MLLHAIRNRQSIFASVVDLKPEDFVAEDWLCAFRDLVGIDDYVMVTANKPTSHGQSNP
jgi:hypothetical protein